MEQYGLDLHGQMILEAYRSDMAVFEKMRQFIDSQLHGIVEDNGLYVTAIESRVKSEQSLAGKLQLKGSKYASLSDITDILGARVVAFYSDEVDKIAALIETRFDVDWDNSVDKRKLLELDRFGYRSLHYVCHIPPSLFADESMPQLNEYRFEIQMRTALQHVWATMYHDTGYKSGMEIPKTYLRSLNRMAGLLEIADEEFSKLRIKINDYRRQVHALVADGNFDAVNLDGDSFNNYLALNPFKYLIEKIASINQAEIYQDTLRPYLPVMQGMGFKTLGDVERMRFECSEYAYQLALHQLATTDIDIVALSLSLQNLCIVHIYKQGGGIDGLLHFYNMLFGDNGYNATRAHRTLEQLDKINIV
ncbi:MAG: RelA/SpoT domain-containing protein [bacterium P3]|nr:MAG: RelA/SpoT domain-containing protein [bacterium P3]KWW42158.1 MAG: RelA/SpoT domain-containing protein [bacterium F083]